MYNCNIITTGWNKKKFDVRGDVDCKTTHAVIYLNCNGCRCG